MIVSMVVKMVVSITNKLGLCANIYIIRTCFALEFLAHRCIWMLGFYKPKKKHETRPIHAWK